MRRLNLILLFLLFQSAAGYCAAPPYELYLKGNLSQAASAYAELAAASPADPRPLMNAAICLKQAGRYYQASSLMTRALERAPENPEIGRAHV